MKNKITVKSFIRLRKCFLVVNGKKSIDDLPLSSSMRKKFKETEAAIATQIGVPAGQLDGLKGKVLNMLLTGKALEKYGILAMLFAKDLVRKMEDL